jgi:hypothetical protein
MPQNWSRGSPALVAVEDSMKPRTRRTAAIMAG